MSNESTPQVPAEQPTSGLPQFDPNAPVARPATDDTQQLPSATTTEMPVTPPATPYAYAVSPGAAAPIAGPDVPLSPTGLPVREKPAGAATAGDGPRWNAKKTAVTAGLALALTSAGAIGAAAAMPAGATGGDTGFRGPGGGRSFQFPGGQQGLTNPNQQVLPNQQGTSPQQLPNLQNGVPGGGQSGIDPNQLGQLDPQDLLQQLGLGVDPFGDDQGQDPFSDPGQDDSGSGTSGSATTT
ncbi:hypothetical protein [Terrabacter sp. Root181]|uniref:hypothetical protein n=1 Tax=Terrabacter sp. Root181 TaxID=1736484 RepID=UPI0006FD5A18|nr:hypothetical protein [Terrabacter sp. Root181]KRB47362.1 hypothetical protein ASD90_03095 [Terrabacter sp. Root181]